MRHQMRTEIPASITTPDRVDTRIGLLEFFDGYPTPDTARRCVDHLLLLRGVEVFLNWMPAASLVAVRAGFREVGITRNGIVGVDRERKDSRPLFLTANMDSVYAQTWLDLRDGPVVVESPPNTLGMVDDFFFRYVADLGNAGPDRGQGGRYLFLPPDFDGDAPDGYFTFRSPTYGNAMFWRGFLVDGDPAPAVASIEQHTRIYPLDRPDLRDTTRFLDLSGRTFNTIHANDIGFYAEIDEVIQEEPADAFDPELLGLAHAIGIRKGHPFDPDERTREILSEAAAIGNATARTLSFRHRASDTTAPAALYPDSAWFNPFVGGYRFEDGGARLLDARTMFHYTYTGVTPAMEIAMVGVGSQYGCVCLDADGDVLDGGRTYRLHLPPDIPAKDFWSVMVYDPQTRSMLQTDQRFPGLNSTRSGVEANADGSIDLVFGPEAPPSRERNWIQTLPGKGFMAILRIYGPLEAWFDHTWRPGEITKM
jgi:hypothetical protein